jgi:hypothetical protein
MWLSWLCSPIAVDQLVTWVRGEATLFELEQQCAANGISGVSGMLLIMNGFVRENPDKRRMCAKYRGRNAA